MRSAFRVLEVVKNHSAYKDVEKSYPRRSDYRVEGWGL